MITQQAVRPALSPTDRGQGDRLAGYAGIAFVVLSIASFAPGRPPAFNAPIAELTRYASDKSALLLASAWLSMLSLPALLLLVTRLRDRVRRRAAEAGEGGEVAATLATFFHAAYASALAIAGVAFIVTALPAFEAARLGQTSEATVRFAVDLSTVLFGLHLVVVTVAIATISLCVALTAALPRWVATTGAIVALGTLTASLGVFSGGLLKVLLVVAYLPGLLWWGAVSVALLRGGRRA
jgi:hypothetical protein